MTAWQWFDCFGRSAHKIASFPQQVITALRLRINSKLRPQLILISRTLCAWVREWLMCTVTCWTVTLLDNRLNNSAIQYGRCWHKAHYTPTKHIQQQIFLSYPLKRLPCYLGRMCQRCCRLYMRMFSAVFLQCHSGVLSAVALTHVCLMSSSDWANNNLNIFCIIHCVTPALCGSPWA